MTDDGIPSGGPGPRPAVRLICAVEGGEVRVLSSRRLTKVVPPSDDLALPDEPAAERAGELHARRSGFWIEVRDRSGRVRYRQVVPDPLAGEVEVPGTGGSFTRRASAPAAFALLFPDLPDADHVALVRGAPARAAGRAVSALAERTGEVARLSLRELASRAGEAGRGEES